MVQSLDYWTAEVYEKKAFAAAADVVVAAAVASSVVFHIAETASLVFVLALLPPPFVDWRDHSSPQLDSLYLASNENYY